MPPPFLFEGAGGFSWREVYALALALVFCVVAWALSPLAPIPDFIPIPGLLDDLILLPVGIMPAKRLPLDDCRKRMKSGTPVGAARRYGVVVVVVIQGGGFRRSDRLRGANSISISPG